MSVEIAATEEVAPIRPELVETAVKFLQNPNVQKTTLSEQQRFLRRKGLTHAEIKEACEKSGAYTFYEQQQNRPPVPFSNQQMQISPYGNYSVVQLTMFQKIKEIVFNMAVVSFLGYAIYKFYEKFIAPFLFGKTKKSVEDSLQNLDKDMRTSLDEIRNNLASVKIDIEKISQGAESSTQRQLSDLKSEISTVKGLLLSRNQFPQVSKTSSLRSSIPAWQKSSINQDSDPDSDPERKVEELMELGSGSGSEHNTQKSDSSLEIISFSSKDSDFHRRKSEVETEEDNDDKE